jgi:non-specific serine/threonine protein kinase/serine/threonine-protein kinase
MTPEQFVRLRGIFAQASELPATARVAFVTSACAGDEALVKQVMELLAASDTVGSRFNPDSTAMGRELLDLPRDEVPAQIGPYRIGSVIGRGGMGAVYEAEQRNPQRRVALKVIKLGMDTAQVVARFEQERQALAILDHPNIAKVLDAGVTETGRPYFVMEFVQGVPIAEYCDTNKLSIEERLGLFDQVCQAVQHAHTKGIIHRDLKPSNVLVSMQDGKATAKVIDFGVAKATASKLTERTLFTEHQQLIGTPEYMSPEQAEGSLDIDTRTDVYSLGVLLYELLTGTTPFDSRMLRAAAYGEIQRIIREVDPPKPSTRLSQSKETLAGVAAKRHTEPARLASTIRGELDWIVMKALEKERQRRYETANGLAMDVRRYLSGEAVLAVPPSRAYRARKFVVRNTLWVGAVAAVSMALLVGLGASTAMYVREQRARERADAKERLSTAVRKYLISNLLLAAGPDRMGYEVKMLDVLTKASDGLSEQFKDDPEVEGSIRGDLATVLRQIGKTKESVEQWRLAMPRIEAAAGNDSATTIAALNGYGAALQAARMDAEWLAHSQEVMKRASGLDVDSVERLHAINNLGGALVTARRHAEAAPMLREAVARAELNLSKHAEVYTHLLIWLTTCEEAMGNKDAGLEMRRKSVEHAERTYGPDNRATFTTRYNYALVLVRAGRTEESLALIDQIVGPAERAYPPNSPDRGYVYLGVGNILGSARRYEQSLGYLDKARDVFDRAFPDFDWVCEQVTHNYRALYSRWPGHANELKEWCYHGLRARLLLAREGERQNLPDAIASAKKQVEAAGGSFDAIEALDVMWARRDVFAPEGHRRRTSYFANYARLAILLDRREHVEEALRIAESSLSTAIEPENAAPLLEAARREAGK